MKIWVYFVNEVEFDLSFWDHVLFLEMCYLKEREMKEKEKKNSEKWKEKMKRINEKNKCEMKRKNEGNCFDLIGGI